MDYFAISSDSTFMPFTGGDDRPMEKVLNTITRVVRSAWSSKGFPGRTFGTVLASSTGQKAEIASASRRILGFEKDVHK